jgi:AAA domain
MTHDTNPFAPAVKARLKARLALDGPTGSGKTWTALEFATVLAGDGKIAVIDTERDSAKLYANRFTFDTVAFPPPYEVDRLIELLKAAEANGYAVVVIDSLSHFWTGEGGVLDEVDAAGARERGGGNFAGWRHGTPLQRHMVDTILDLDCHVIATMRSKMAYTLNEYEENGKRKTKVEKLGMQPVQREGLEYEFTVVGDMDLDHRITISKSRCDTLADKVIQPNRAHEAASMFLSWLNDGEVYASPAELARIGAAVREVPLGDRQAITEELRARYGPPERLRAAHVEDAIALVRAAVPVAAGDTPPAEVGDHREPAEVNGDDPAQAAEGGSPPLSPASSEDTERLEDKITKLRTKARTKKVAP